MGSLLYEYLIYAIAFVGTLVAILAIASIRKSRKKSSGENHGPASDGEDKRSRFARNRWWIIPIIISIAGLVLWEAWDKFDALLEFMMRWSPFSQSPSLQTVSAFVQNYWLTIFVGYGVLAVTTLVVLNMNSALGWNATAQWILVGVMLILFVGFPIMSPSTTEKSNATLSLNIPDAGEDKSKWPEPFWAKIELSKEGEESGLLPVRSGKRLVMSGKKDFSVNCIYRDGHKISFGTGEQPCPNGDMPWNSVTNKAGEPNIIYFAYRPI